MKAFLALALSLCSGAALSAADLPKEIAAAPSRSAPTIDGVIGADEWKDAPVIKFDLLMFQLKPLKSEKRPCELRVMNSANALYVALRVPDATFNSSLTPLDLDLAVLAFCRGKELAA